MGLAAGLVMLVAGVARAGEPSPSSSTTLDLVMPGARPAVNDAYICASFDMVNMTGGTEPVHVTGFVPHAEANRAHHMLLYACPMPMSEPGIPYDCMHHAMCRWCTRSQNLNSKCQKCQKSRGGQSIMFAWAKNAPPTTLPQGVSFLVDPSQRRYLVLQVTFICPVDDVQCCGERDEIQFVLCYRFITRSHYLTPTTRV